MENEIKQTRGTARQKVYDFLVEFVTENGYAPSLREICVGTGLKSTSSVYEHLLKLEDEGKIEMKRDYSPRAIKLVGYKFVKMEETA